MFNLEHITQQIDNIKNIGMALSDTPIYTNDVILWEKAFWMFLFIFAIALVVAASMSAMCYDRTAQIIGWLTVICLFAGLITLVVHMSELEQESSFEHKNAQFELFHDGKYKFDAKVDIINKSYHDMFGEKYVPLSEIRDHLKIEFLHADEFKKLSDSDQKAIMKAIDELK